jgi:hypothetical protein
MNFSHASTHVYTHVSLKVYCQLQMNKHEKELLAFTRVLSHYNYNTIDSSLAGIKDETYPEMSNADLSRLLLVHECFVPKQVSSKLNGYNKETETERERRWIRNYYTIQSNDR